MPPAIDEDYVRALREKVKNSKKRKAAAQATKTTQPAEAESSNGGSARASKALKASSEAWPAGENGQQAIATSSSTLPATTQQPATSATPARPSTDVEMTNGDDDDDREEGEISDEDGPPPPSPPTPAQSPVPPLPPPPHLPLPSSHPPAPQQMPLGMEAYQAHMLAMMREALVGAERFPPMSAQLREAIQDGSIGRKGKGKGKGKALAKAMPKEPEKPVEVKPVVKEYDPVALGTAALKISDQEYRSTRILLLELISWGVAPEYFVSPLGLSREAILLYFRDLRIRLPTNLPKGPARNRKAKQEGDTSATDAIGPDAVKEEPEAGELEEEEEGEVAEDDEVAGGASHQEEGAVSDAEASASVKPGQGEAPASASQSQPSLLSQLSSQVPDGNTIPTVKSKRDAAAPKPPPATETVLQSSLSPHAVFQQQAAFAAAYPQMYPAPFFGAQPYFDPSSGFYSAFNAAALGYQPQQQFLQAWPPQIQQPQQPTPDTSPPLPPPPPPPQVSPPPPPNSPPPALPPNPAPPLDLSTELPVVAAAHPAPPMVDAAPAIVYTSSSTRLVRKLPAKRPSALDLDQPATASTLSPASDQAAAYVPFFSSDRLAMRQLVADPPRRLVIDISDDEGDSADNDQPPADTRMKLSTLAPTVRAKSSTPSSDSLQAYESEIQRMTTIIAAMEKKQKARSPSAQPTSKAASPVLSTLATPLPELPSSSSTLSVSSVPTTPSVPVALDAKGGEV